MSEWSVIGAGLALIVALWATYARARPIRPDPVSQLALKFAALEAVMRRHASFTIDHLLLALLFDSNVAAACRAAGGDPSAIRRKLHEELGSVVESDQPKVTPKIDPVLEAVLKSAYARRRSIPQDVILEEIARGPDSLAKSLLPSVEALTRLTPHKPRGGRDARNRQSSSLVDCDASATSAYRSGRAFAGDTQVRLFNDEKTTLGHVNTMLTKTFGLTDACARYVALRVHDLGSAAIGPWPREEAAKLVETATEAARAAGFPLRLALERSTLDA